MEGVLPLGLTLVLVSFFILVAVARLYLLIQEMPLLVSGTLIKLGWKVKVNSRAALPCLGTHSGVNLFHTYPMLSVCFIRGIGYGWRDSLSLPIPWVYPLWRPHSIR